MARIVGPLMSMDARGNFAKGAMQFRSHGKGVHCYQPRKASKPPSTGQLLQRTKYRQALLAWRLLSDSERDSWDALAADEGLMGWNAYLRFFVRRGMFACRVTDTRARLVWDVADSASVCFPSAIPDSALVTESGEPLVTEDGEYLIYG